MDFTSPTHDPAAADNAAGERQTVVYPWEVDHTAVLSAAIDLIEQQDPAQDPYSIEDAVRLATNSTMSLSPDLFPEYSPQEQADIRYRAQTNYENALKALEPHTPDGTEQLSPAERAAALRSAQETELWPVDPQAEAQNQAHSEFYAANPDYAPWDRELTTAETAGIQQRADELSADPAEQSRDYEHDDEEMEF